MPDPKQLGLGQVRAGPGYVLPDPWSAPYSAGEILLETRGSPSELAACTQCCCSPLGGAAGWLSPSGAHTDPNIHSALFTDPRMDNGGIRARNTKPGAA